MIAFQYNKTSLQHLEKQLKMRVRTLPIIKSKESALRMEVKRCKEDMEKHDEAYAAQLEQYRALFALWTEFDTELVKEFFEAFVRRANITLHIRELAGENSHHIIEGAFKSVARSLRAAVKLDPDAMGEIPSTKGIL
jgi:vacuolar-type H+-ATPase subunit D/Vma8